jgi:hypothetical protein
MSNIDLIKLGLVHIAALINVSGMFFRDQFMLRLLVLVSTFLYIVYYIIVPATPLWDAIAWCVVLIGVNAIVMGLIMLDRKQFLLTDAESRLFRSLLTFSPGEFRRLMKAANWKHADDSRKLTIEGKSPESLFFVLEGDIEVSKLGRSLSVPAGVFIGEIGFLLNRPASATVKVKSGARYVEWSREALSSLLNKYPALKTALDARLSIDLASKVAAS